MGEAQLAEPATDREPRLVAVAPRLEHANRGLDDLIGRGEVSDPLELIDNDALLQPKLEVVRRVLPATAAAALDIVRAGRLDPLADSVLQLDELRTAKIAPHFVHLHDSCFAWQST